MLKVEQIQVGYSTKIVLHGVSLTLQPGELLALIGPNGSGKSTLLRAISGVLPLQSGTVAINDKEVSRMTHQERARQIAVVPQARNLPPAFTGREVVALGRTPYLNWLGQISAGDEERIQEAMCQTDTLELADRMINELSGGEQQRLLLARALVQQTPLLLLDEPTTHLDLQFQYGLMQRIHRLAHPPKENGPARAVLVALHDLNLAFEYADRVALLVKGQIVHTGTPAEVLQPDILSEVYNIPLTLMRDPISGKTALIPGK
jgi:ABC-type cobalamin/Fe3+-siderophores transport system ATPase subunit